MSAYIAMTTGAPVTCFWPYAAAASAALSDGSRTTTKRQGCRLNAEGASGQGEEISESLLAHRLVGVGTDGAARARRQCGRALWGEVSAVAVTLDQDI